MVRPAQIENVRIGLDGKRMLLVPAGWFLMGTSDADIVEMQNKFGWNPKWFADETPQHPVFLDAYYMDETPVTNVEYKRFLDAHPQRAAPPDWDRLFRTFVAGQADHPVVAVSWDDANDYARWAGKRLPTEAEWEKAAVGPTVASASRRYPWGSEFDVARCNSKMSNTGGTTSVVRYAPQGKSPYGILDLAGNVWEWCVDWYVANYYYVSPTHNPHGPESGDWRVLRGGAWDTTPDYVRAANRDYIVPEVGYAAVGFRCVLATNQNE